MHGVFNISRTELYCIFAYCYLFRFMHGRTHSSNTPTLTHLIIPPPHLNNTHPNSYSVPSWYSGNRTRASLDPLWKPPFDSSQRS